jgi:hypothetical protein
MMLYSTYNLVVSGVLLLIISFVATVAPAIWIIVASGICCFAVLFSLSVLFIPKMIIHFSGDTVSVNDMFGKAIKVSRSKSNDDKTSDRPNQSDRSYPTNNNFNSTNVNISIKPSLIEQNSDLSMGFKGSFLFSQNNPSISIKKSFRNNKSLILPSGSTDEQQANITGTGAGAGAENYRTDQATELLLQRARGNDESAAVVDAGAGDFGGAGGVGGKSQPPRRTSKNSVTGFTPLFNRLNDGIDEDREGEREGANEGGDNDNYQGKRAESMVFSSIHNTDYHVSRVDAMGIQSTTTTTVTPTATAAATATATATATTSAI